MRVWLIRHAATTAPPGLAIGAGDPPLSELGRREAHDLAAGLANRRLGGVWSSDSRRAVETAAIIAASHGLAVMSTAALREIDFGAWEGRHLSELWDEDPAGAQAWEADIRQTPRSFGESVAELELRVRAFWEGLALNGEIAVVAHRGSLAALQSVIVGQPFADSFRVPARWVDAQSLEESPPRG